MIKYIDYSADKIEIDDFYDKIAYVAHNCYQVEGKTPNRDFVTNLIKSSHLAMIEHFVFHFMIDEKLFIKLQSLMNKYIVLSKTNEDNQFLLTLSCRPLLENRSIEEFIPIINALPSDVSSIFNVKSIDESHIIVPIDEAYLKHLYEINIISEKVYKEHCYRSIKIITDRGVTHELVRHRPCSFAQESTRYCNYSKNKFGNSITLIKPLDYDKYADTYDKYYQSFEDGYFELINKGARLDVARALLPNGLKTSIIVTASLEEWDHIFELRMANGAHPDMIETMKRVKEVIDEKR